MYCILFMHLSIYSRFFAICAKIQILPGFTGSWGGEIYIYKKKNQFLIFDQKKQLWKQGEYIYIYIYIYEIV